MQTRFNINDYYIREHICGNCGCICSKDAQECHVCGCGEIREVVESRSCNESHYCMNKDCGYVTHKEFRYCPHCGTKTKGCYTMIPEDHWGIPIPSEKNCEGVLKDDDEAFERSVYLKDMMGERR